MDLYQRHDKLQNESKDSLCNLADAKGDIERLREQYDKRLMEKEEELGALEMKLKSLESDCSTLRKQNKAIESSGVEMQDRYNCLKDRFSLLEREKGNLKFEIDTIQADHDALGEQVRVLSEKTFSLEAENKRLKAFIDNMKFGDSHSAISENVTCSGSTWNSDSRLSYETLATNMDSMIENKTSSKSDATLAISAEPIPEERGKKCDNENLDDSFDESMFLPNSEDRTQGRDTSEMLHRTETEEEKAHIEVYHEHQDSPLKKSSVTFCATPNKCSKDDYGNRRIPLSDRKNKTPMTKQSKRLRSSAKKVMSSTKKSQTNYLLIDNRQLFK